MGVLTKKEQDELEQALSFLNKPSKPVDAKKQLKRRIDDHFEGLLEDAEQIASDHNVKFSMPKQEVQNLKNTVFESLYKNISGGNK